MRWDLAMIVPLTSEGTWISALATLPTWRPPAVRTVVVSPHPDDETLGAGGLIALQRRRGIEVAVTAVTDGERAYSNEADAVLGRVRAQEQGMALARLGVAEERVVRTSFPDSDVSSREGDLVESLMDLVCPETMLVAPWEGDFHPDHEACGRAAAEVARRTGAALVSYFFWTWHRGTPELLQDLPLQRLALDTAMCKAKAEALACHASQLERAGGEPILPADLLGPAARPFEVFWVR